MKAAGWISVSAASLAGGAVAFWLLKNSRFWGERAPYRCVLKDGEFEVREYASLTLAGTQVTDDDGSFTRLFAYISGENRTGQEMAMTTPVLIADEGGERTMNFVLPEAIAKCGAPPANRPEIEEATLPAGRFAVYRYRGFNDLLAESGNAAVLRSWMRVRGLKPLGEAVVALYDPPWIPGPFRRNEVLLRIDDRS